MRRAALALVFLTASPALAQREEIRSTYRDARKDFLAGRYQKAANNYQYLVTLGSLDPVPIANLALMYRDLGEPQFAAAHWLKGTLLRPGDTFLWNQRGWNYLALGRFREARDSFRKAIEVSSSSVYGAESYFGLGMTESIDGNSKTAASALRQSAAMGNPYLRAAANAELGRIAMRGRKWTKAIPFLRASLAQDPMQADIARDLAAVYDKTGQASAAWQAMRILLSMVPDDKEAAKKKAKLEKYIQGKAADRLPLVRLARPLLRKPKKGHEKDLLGPKLRVAMFTGPDGRPRHLSRFFVMGSTRTRLWDMRLEEQIEIASTYTQWEVLYRSDNRVIEIRDTTGRIIYVTKQPFRFEPMSPGYSILIKNPEIRNPTAIDPSDRELRGSIEIIPTPFGFHIVNELRLDQYLFSVISGSLPRTKALEAYKAVAVIKRSEILDRVLKARPNAERTHLCDSSACIPYFGLSKERAIGTRAVRATRGVTMHLKPGLELEQHAACGWITAAGIQDRPTPAIPFRHPYAFERLIRGFPDPAQYGEAAAAVPSIWNRWVRVLDARTLRRNMSRIQDIGFLRDVRVTSRDGTGRIKGLLVIGARGQVELGDASGIRRFLSPGSLRSTMVSLQPLYKNKRLRRLVVWGAGTGHGRGLCTAGTLGQAHLGRPFYKILKHYFPNGTIKGLRVPRRRARKKRRRTLKPGVPGQPSSRPPRRRRRRRR